MRRRICLLLALCMTLTLLTVGAFAAGTETEGFLGEDLTWSLDDAGTLTISGTGAMPNYSNGRSPFYQDARIRAVVIEPGVTNVGDNAFEWCANLETVTLSDTVTSIGHGAFIRTGLRSFDIPATVQSVGEGAFMACWDLEHVTIPDSIRKIEAMTFRECESLTEIVIPDSITEIGVSAFNACCGLTRVIIPDGVTRIQESTFLGCEALKEIQIPVAVTEVGDDAFTACAALTDVYYPGTEAQWNAVTIQNEELPSDNPYIYLMENYPLLNATVHFRSRLPMQFADVADDAFYAEAVNWAYTHCVTLGTGGGKFSPDAPCTRAQAVTFLWRAMGEPEPVSADNPFSDVSESDWYCKAVLWAVENGITLGVGGGRFDPDGTCSRAQIVTFLWRAEGRTEPESADNPFSDVADDSWYCKPVLWAVENRITLGVGGGRFDPDGSCSRAQIVTFLFRDLA